MLVLQIIEKANFDDPEQGNSGSGNSRTPFYRNRSWKGFPLSRCSGKILDPVFNHTEQVVVESATQAAVGSHYQQQERLPVSLVFRNGVAGFCLINQRRDTISRSFQVYGRASVMRSCALRKRAAATIFMALLSAVCF
jgi:hypothetical protein